MRQLRASTCFVALRNSSIRSAGSIPRVGPNVTSTWLGPNSTSSERSGMPSAWRLVRSVSITGSMAS
jgi:hypothetical protein